MQTPSTVQGESRGLHRKEILDQMSANICINLEDEESNISIPITPKPIFYADSPYNKNTSASGEVTSEIPDRSRSADSISNELSHFRPIRSCPLTPPRRLPSGQVVEPMVIRTTPRNLSKSALGSPLNDERLAEIDAGSPIMRRRLSELAEERKDKVRYKRSKDLHVLQYVALQTWKMILT